MGGAVYLGLIELRVTPLPAVLRGVRVIARRRRVWWKWTCGLSKSDIDLQIVGRGIKDPRMDTSMCVESDFVVAGEGPRLKPRRVGRIIPGPEEAAEKARRNGALKCPRENSLGRGWFPSPRTGLACHCCDFPRIASSPSAGTPSGANIHRSLRELFPLRGFGPSSSPADTEGPCSLRVLCRMWGL